MLGAVLGQASAKPRGGRLVRGGADALGARRQLLLQPAGEAGQPAARQQRRRLWLTPSSGVSGGTADGGEDEEAADAEEAGLHPSIKARHLALELGQL